MCQGPGERGDAVQGPDQSRLGQDLALAPEQAAAEQQGSALGDPKAHLGCGRSDCTAHMPPEAGDTPAAAGCCPCHPPRGGSRPGALAHKWAPYQHIPHVQQQHSWDCGLACALMVLRSVGIQQCELDYIASLCQTTSVWSIDLAHLLRRFGLEVCLCTITMGPNPAYANEGFYAEHLQEDEARVAALFRSAPLAGIYLEQRSVEDPELQAILLSGAFLVVALVDKRKLDPWLKAAERCLPSLCGLTGGIGYQGHYILLVGYDAELQEYLIRDPSCSQADASVSAWELDLARRSFGTDEDLLLVSLAPGMFPRHLAPRWHPHTPVTQEAAMAGGAPGPASPATAGAPLETTATTAAVGPPPAPAPPVLLGAVVHPRSHQIDDASLSQ